MKERISNAVKRRSKKNGNKTVAEHFKDIIHLSVNTLRSVVRGSHGLASEFLNFIFVFQGLVRQMKEKRLHTKYLIATLGRASSGECISCELEISCTIG